VSLALWVPLAAGLIVLLWDAIDSRRLRHKRLEEIAEQWGRPRSRVRDMQAIAEYYRSSPSAGNDAAVLDAVDR
jgi:hypothetical protein